MPVEALEQDRLFWMSGRDDARASDAEVAGRQRPGLIGDENATISGWLAVALQGQDT